MSEKLTFSSDSLKLEREAIDRLTVNGYRRCTECGFYFKHVIVTPQGHYQHQPKYDFRCDRRSCVDSQRGRNRGH